jgi:biopolymer transport protein TolR
MIPYRIQRHRKREHHDNHMALVPFIDMLMIMVVFLLVHNADVEILPNTNAISIPESISDRDPRASVVVMVTKTELLVDGRVVAQLSDLAATDTLVIPSLRAALKEQSDKALITAANQSVAEREITVMGDRNTPFAVLKKIMATCTDADYGKVSLAVLERDPRAAGGL